MRLVLTAMRRPITIVVAAGTIGLLSAVAMQRMRNDSSGSARPGRSTSPSPTGGMDASQMGATSPTTTVHFLYITGIEHVESKNIRESP